MNGAIAARTTDNKPVTASAETILFHRIHAALPQTQCTRCGFPDCEAYARAIVAGDAAINQCPPGGAEGVQRLAAITGLPTSEVNPANGLEAPRSVAVIDESWCIGCTLCLPVCPTDAILGSNKLMHTVIESACTGCELCIAVCPVDCISLENTTGDLMGWQAWSQPQADKALTRYAFHSLSRQNSLDKVDKTQLSISQNEAQSAQKQSVIKAALAKARAERSPNDHAS